MKDCCNKMKVMVEEDYLITEMANIPFSVEKSDPTVYISSDRGHGGMEKIDFCPFCGKKIEFPIVKRTNIDW